jgi:hypothetical protein
VAERGSFGVLEIIVVDRYGGSNQWPPDESDQRGPTPLEASDTKDHSRSRA